MTDRDVRRIIDANLNRSREGLRVCEEIARFSLGSRSLMKELKSVRHAVSAAAREHYALPGAVSCSRDSERDVGRASKSAGEMRRRGMPDIFAANAQRVKESFRVLEEFYKLIDAGMSSRFSRLRFRFYDIEKKAFKRFESLRDS
jgi:thiamine-phosphate pyrophosphorylase